MLERSAIVLAGGGSTRMRVDKGLRELGGEPLVRHIVRRVSGLVDEVLVVVGSDVQREAYKGVLDGDAELLVDLYDGGSPLVGAITGLSRARGRYAFITGCDSPFLSPEAIRVLFSESEGFDGATFQWPNGWIEPLMAVYRAEPSLRHALEAYRIGDMRLRRVLRELPKLKLIPIERLRSLDPRLLTLFDIDTEDTLSQAQEILREMKNALEEQEIPSKRPHHRAR